VLARVADGSGSQVGILGGSWRHGSAARVLLLTASVKAAALAVALPHANVAADSNSAALVGNGLAERGTLHESRELLGAEDVERLRLDLHPPVHPRGKVGIGRL
jgi:hypothetical protein